MLPSSSHFPPLARMRALLVMALSAALLSTDNARAVLDEDLPPGPNPLEFLGFESQVTSQDALEFGLGNILKGDKYETVEIWTTLHMNGTKYVPGPCPANGEVSISDYKRGLLGLSFFFGRPGGFTATYLKIETPNRFNSLSVMSHKVLFASKERTLRFSVLNDSDSALVWSQSSLNVQRSFLHFLVNQTMTNALRRVTHSGRYLDGNIFVRDTTVKVGLGFPYIFEKVDTYLSCDTSVLPDTSTPANLSSEYNISACSRWFRVEEELPFLQVLPTVVAWMQFWAVAVGMVGVLYNAFKRGQWPLLVADRPAYSLGSSFPVFLTAFRVVFGYRPVVLQSPESHIQPTNLNFPPEGDGHSDNTSGQVKRAEDGESGYGPTERPNSSHSPPMSKQARQGGERTFCMYKCSTFCAATLFVMFYMFIMLRTSYSYYYHNYNVVDNQAATCWRTSEYDYAVLTTTLLLACMICYLFLNVFCLGKCGRVSLKVERTWQWVLLFAFFVGFAILFATIFVNFVIILIFTVVGSIFFFYNDVILVLSVLIVPVHEVFKMGRLNGSVSPDIVRCKAALDQASADLREDERDSARKAMGEKPDAEHILERRHQARIICDLWERQDILVIALLRLCDEQVEFSEVKDISPVMVRFLGCCSSSLKFRSAGPDADIFDGLAMEIRKRIFNHYVRAAVRTTAAMLLIGTIQILLLHFGELTNVGPFTKLLVPFLFTAKVGLDYFTAPFGGGDGDKEKKQLVALAKNILSELVILGQDATAARRRLPARHSVSASDSSESAGSAHTKEQTSPAVSFRSGRPYAPASVPHSSTDRQAQAAQQASTSSDHHDAWDMTSHTQSTPLSYALPDPTYNSSQV